MFKSGQRWYSEAEPELGLGIILEVENKLVQINYPLCEETRTYGRTSSPLKRYIVNAEEELTTSSGETYIVDSAQENEGIYFYLSGKHVIPEMNLTAKIDLQGPMNRIIASNFDSNDFYKLRYDTFLEYRHYQSFDHKGKLGPKVRLIPHQIFVADKILNLEHPKAMLCDEVGLGKTIETSLILNSLIQRELVQRCLIIVPDSLVNQWFVELYKKFNLSFKTVNDETFSEIDFPEADRIIVGHQTFKTHSDAFEVLAAEKWDMLIIDESHQINISDQNSEFVRFIKEVNSNTYSTLFLSATPEVLGTENLFNQLNLLDPLKYKSYSEFSEQIEVSRELSARIIELKNNQIDKTKLERYISASELLTLQTPQDIIQVLVDRFGTGRSYFRNSRQNLEQYSRLFNDRVLHSYPTKIDKKITDKIVIEHKAAHILDLLDKNPEDKILIICHSKEVVLKLQQILLEARNLKLAIFHSAQSLMERDRQAAYFGEPTGAQILISTEIGSEGRNFEFASHLFLFDLPKVPDQLEQRIGRLDRIGQMNDINVHVPYIQGSFEETMFRWYNEVLNSFESSPKGAGHFYNENKEELIKILECQFDSEVNDTFFKEKKQTYSVYCKKIEEGRDLIVEAHSYDDVKAKNLCREISNFEQKTTPQNFFEQICNHIGLELEELNDNTYFVKPSDNMLIPSYPGLTAEGISFSYDRIYSLTKDNIHLLSWEHPMIQGAFDLLINSQLGNTTFIQQNLLPRNIYFEFILSIQCTDKYKYISSTFLPFTPVRILLDIKGADLTKEYSKKMIDGSIEKADNSAAVIDLIKKIPNDNLVGFSKTALKLTQARITKYQTKAKLEAEARRSSEIARINNLSLNHDAKLSSTSKINFEFDSIISSICDAKISLDSIRVVTPKN
jgi:ATP-dependent helicase HepA